jgi:hypothetical protein
MNGGELFIQIMFSWCRHKSCYFNPSWIASTCDTDSTDCDQQQQSHSNALHDPESIDNSTMKAAAQSHNDSIQHNSTETLQSKTATAPDEVVHTIPLSTQLYNIINAATRGIPISTMLQKLTTVHTEAAVQDALVELQLEGLIYSTNGSYLCI